MSHIVTIKTQVRDANAVRAACNLLQLPQPVQGTHRLFSGKVAGLGVQLPDWRYPVICQLESGQVCSDSYQGRGGNQKHLDAFLQAYAVEKATIEARRQGHSVTEQALNDAGSAQTLADPAQTGD